jgi:peptidoglycan hydrolase-like protein with peptidoglycan-binding domain
VLQTLGWGHRDAVAFLVASAATVAILINVLFMQSGPHPAPMFKSALVASAPAPVAVRSTSGVAQPRTRAADAAAPKAEAPAAPAPTRPGPEIVADIQRELQRRGFFEGVVDGRHGPRTDTAVRDFEQAAGLKPSGEPNEALLQAIRRSNVKAAKMNLASASTTTGVTPPRPPQPVRNNDPIADVLSSTRRVQAVQRALAEFGYGQIKPTGTVDAETRAAIEKFERERKLPVTGQVSDRVARELASITGRPLE